MTLIGEQYNDPAEWTADLLDDPAAMAVIEARLRNPFWRLNNLYYVHNEHGELVQFQLRELQKSFLLSLHGRDILLKARQGGFTTATDIYFLDRAIFNADVRVGISAHKKKDAENIFSDKILTPYNHLPELIRRKVSAKVARKGELEFSNGSMVRVAVSLRSGTYQCVHISEYGPLCYEAPKKAEEVHSGTLNTAHKGSIVVIESTARGAAGLYYQMVQEAQQRAKDGAPLQWNEWKFHFSAWWQDSKYRLEPPLNWREPKAQHRYMAAVERQMHTVITREQRYWYFIKSKEQKGKMKQEFPSTPEEAFLHSGRGVFDRDKLAALDGECFSPRARFSVSPSGHMHPDPQGELKIWEQPKTTKAYGIGADVAEGLDEQDGDASAFHVVDQTGFVVASYNGQVSPGFYGVILNSIGRYYGNALMIVERNNHGHTTLSKLEELNYPNLYSEETIGRKSKKLTKKLGWGTDSVSKTLMIDELVEAVESDNSLMIPCQQTIGEMFTYIIDKKGSYNALPGAKDDRVIAMALANQARKRLGAMLRRQRAQAMANTSAAQHVADTTTGY